MTASSTSRTAEYMALFRALESGRGAARLFDDPLALGFLRPSLRAAVRLARVPLVGEVVPWLLDHRWPGARSSGVARTRFIDDAVESAIAGGIDQVVLLGAGFDARAQRLASMASVRVFELDRPPTQVAKRAALYARGEPPGATFATSRPTWTGRRSTRSSKPRGSIPSDLPASFGRA
jgi:methyltransferase (TIGR00027 family)